MNKAKTTNLTIHHVYNLGIGRFAKSSGHALILQPRIQCTDKGELTPCLDESLLVPIPLVKHAQINTRRTSLNGP